MMQCDAMEILYRNPVAVDKVETEVWLVNCRNISDPGSRQRSGTHIFILGRKKKEKKMISAKLMKNSTFPHTTTFL